MVVLLIHGWQTRILSTRLNNKRDVTCDQTGWKTDEPEPVENFTTRSGKHERHSEEGRVAWARLTGKTCDHLEEREPALSLIKAMCGFIL